MGDYKINIVNLNVTNNYVEITAELEGDVELYYPRISACFYGENDNRILPMDLKSCNKNKAIAIGIFDTPFLFYNDRKSQNVRVNFLFSDGNGESIIVKPEKELIIPIKKKNILSHFFSSSKRERSKMIVTALMSAMFLPYRKMKVQPNKVTFLSNRSDRLTGNIKSVFFEMTKLNNVDITVLCKKGGLKANLPNLFKFFKLYATSSVVFVDDYYHFLSYLKKKDDVKLIQLWHACGAFKTFGFTRLGKKGGPKQTDPNHRMYDYAIVSSQEIAKHYAEGFGLSDENVVATGIPRTDIFMDKEYASKIRSSFYERYPQLKNKKIMLFAPTFRGNGQMSAFYPTDAFDIEKAYEGLGGEYAILIKLHPFCKERFEIPEKYSDMIIDMSDEDELNDLLFVTDLLVTDYSSVIFEASLLNIPMMFYAFDLYDYIASRDFYYDFEGFVPGKIVFSENELINAINKKDFESEKVDGFKNKFFDDLDGKSSERVTDLILENLDI